MCVRPRLGRPSHGLDAPLGAPPAATHTRDDAFEPSTRRRAQGRACQRRRATRAPTPAPPSSVRGRWLVVDADAARLRLAPHGGNTTRRAARRSGRLARRGTRRRRRRGSIRSRCHVRVAFASPPRATAARRPWRRLADRSLARARARRRSTAGVTAEARDGRPAGPPRLRRALPPSGAAAARAAGRHAQPPPPPRGAPTPRRRRRRRARGRRRPRRDIADAADAR